MRGYRNTNLHTHNHQEVTALPVITTSGLCNNQLHQSPQPTAASFSTPQRPRLFVLAGNKINKEKLIPLVQVFAKYHKLILVAKVPTLATKLACSTEKIFCVSVQ